MISACYRIELQNDAVGVFGLKNRYGFKCRCLNNNDYRPNWCMPIPKLTNSDLISAYKLLSQQKFI